jgi:hypothetical protein
VPNSRLLSYAGWEQIICGWPARETYRERSGVRHVVVFEPVTSPPADPA